MDFEEKLHAMKIIQNYFIDFIDNKSNTEESFQNLQQIFDDQKIKDDQYYIISLLQLISRISDNHKRSCIFFEKIEKILLYFKNSIKEKLSNYYIFDIFKNNKRILLFFIEENIMVLDDFIISKISTDQYKTANYLEYFSPEINVYKNKNDPIQDFDHFNKCRKIGENDNYVCTLIQKDLLEPFVIYVYKNNYSLKSTIDQSIFETNLYLLQMHSKSSINLIEYSAFFGSVKIFNYLYKSNIKLTPSLWLYAIHGNNPEIIQILLENNIKPYDKTYEECYERAIKCYHNEIAYYIKSNFLKSNENEQIKILKYFNYEFFNDFIHDEKLINYMVCYGYSYLLKYKLESNMINNENLLIKAIENEQIYTIKLLLSYSDTDVNIEQKLKHSDYYNSYWIVFPLYLAVTKENHEIVRLLLSHKKIDVNKKMIISSSNWTNDEIINVNNFKKSKLRIFLFNGKKEDDNDKKQLYIEMTVLHAAIETKNYQIIQLLLSNSNIDVNAKVFKIYSYKIFKTYNNVYKNSEEYDYETITHKVRISKSVLVLAISAYSEEDFSNKNIIIEALLNHPKIDVNFGIKRECLLHYVYWYQSHLNKHDHLNYYKILHCSKTPLFIAIENNDDNLSNILSSNPKINFNNLSNIDHYNELKRKFNFFVDQFGYKKNAKKQINKFINDNIRESSYLTDLQFAIENNKINIIKKVLNMNNFDVNMKIQKKTLLIIAIENDNFNIVKLLLSHPRIDVNLKSNNGKTPLSVATEINNNNIIKLLQSHQGIKNDVKVDDDETEIPVSSKKEIVVSFDGNVKNNMKGIISYIGKGKPENEIDVFASSIQDDFDLSNAFIFDNDDLIYYSEEEPNSWFSYDFKQRKIKLKSYSIKEHGFYNNAHHIRSWNIEASNDENEWTILDSHTNDPTINECFKVYTFNIKLSEESEKFYRYIRIRQTGKNSSGNDYLAFSAIEFFGTILEPK